jgi:zinc transporter ZupT
MHLGYGILLFVITFTGGLLPIWFKSFDDKRMHYLLAFSGSFLLSITFLHLLPETFGDLGAKAGIYVLAGFFLQLILQRFTHGVEHGHLHVQQQNDHHHHVPVFSILAGLSVHAFMEGLPLGFNYRMQATEPSLYLAVAAHKLPEAILATTLLLNTKGRRTAVLTMFFFSCITPLAGVLANSLGASYYAMSVAVGILIPIVAGAFIHISTTIFFESGTKNHLLTWQKIFAMICGVSIGFATLLIEY